MKTLAKYLFIGLFLSQMTLSHLYALTFGVVPQQGPFKLIRIWMPIVRYLEQATGQKITLKIEPSIPAFEKSLYRGDYDFAYMNPYHYIIAHKKQNYEAYARAQRNLVGILVVRKDSPIKNVLMTSGKTFLFPSPNAFAATMLIKYDLLRDFHINIDEQKHFLYVNSHDSVYKGVARGVGDVGGGVERTFTNLKDTKTKQELKILYHTHAYPSHPFAFKATMPKEVRQKLVDALLKMPPKLMHSLSITKIIPTNDAKYDTIRHLVKKLSQEKQ